MNCLVLLSTYNGERFLEELLNSVIMQEQVDVDLLIRDDGSSDGTLDIIEKYKSKVNIKCYKGENVKTANSFKQLIYMANDTYDYYALCDQDDVWKSSKLISGIRLLEGIDHPALYSSACEIVDENLNYIKLGGDKKNDFMNPLYDMVMYGTAGCTFVFNKQLLIKLKEHDITSISMHDTWISFVCYAVGGYMYSDENTYILYRQHGTNVIGANNKSFLKNISEIIRFPGILRSEMAKEIFSKYNNEMDQTTKNNFFVFANYKENLLLKIKLLLLKKAGKGDSFKRFIMLKLRVLFNSL